MNLSPDGETFIKGWEQLRLTPYQDSAGKWTVGWGHRLYGAIPSSISEQQAEDYFLGDIDQIADTIDFFNLPLSQQQFDALTSFAFNAGTPALKGSTLMKKVKLGDISGAGEEFEKWDHETVDGVLKENEGLKKRRIAERDIFLNGIYDSSH